MKTNLAPHVLAAVKKLAKLAYPEYKGRKFRFEKRATYMMSDYWSEGSRNYVKAVNLETLKVGLPNAMAHNPLNHSNMAGSTIQIPEGVALVEHSIFCGKDCGITVIVAPQTTISDNPERPLLK